jgi:NADPH-dependent 2,4-dienoyl-CoA reductase/sulfur reductase-like enzyme
MRRVVVVGGSLAGVNAVEELRHRGFQGEITLVSGEDDLPYDKPPLSKAALKDGPQHDHLVLQDAAWYDEHGIDVLLASPAVGLDSRARTVALEDGRNLDYDGLVIATGCSSRPLNGLAKQARIHVVRDLADATTLHHELQPGRHLVVIGAGFIGLEVAATARSLGLEVSVIESAPVPLTRVLGNETGGWFRDFHVAHGTALHCGTGVSRIEADAGGSLIHLADGTVHKADLIVAGIGVIPATGWLEGSGVELYDGVVCDPTLRTSVPEVVAAGDLVRWHNSLFDETMRVEQWLNAVDQGAHAARTLLGEAEPFAHVPYFWSDQFDAKVRFVGRADATDQVEVRHPRDNSVVTLFGHADVVRGALCINAPRQLALLKRAIQTGTSWQDALDIAG